MNNPTAGTEQPGGDGVVSLAQSEAEADAQPQGDTALPEKVAYLPTVKPSEGFPSAGLAVAEEASAETPSQQAAAQAADRSAPAGKEQVLTAAPEEPRAEQVLTAAQTPTPQQKKGLFSLFSANRAAAAPLPQKAEQPRRLIEEEKKPAPLLKLAAADIDAGSGHSSGSYGSDALPGVRRTALFEIKRKSGIDDESDVDLNEDDGMGPIRVASAAGLARLAPNGLLRQTDTVDTACLKPALVSTLRKIEQHFGRKLVVTSGYRSPTYNRQVRGARNSQHMYCAAADIQVPGVTKWELAAYTRSLPGRGGVGTYCHTESVHVDIGPERDWNWRCRRRKI